MNTDNIMVLILLSFLAVARCTDLEPLASSDEENKVEPTDGSTVGVVSNIGGADDLHAETGAAEPTTTVVADNGHRSGRQFYQPSAAFAYQPYPQRRAYKKSPGPSMKRPKFRTKPGSGRRGLRPRRRPSGQLPMSGGPQPVMSSGSRYRRFPGPMLRPQHVNYIDTAGGGGTDYDDGFESAPLPISSFDYGDLREFDHEQVAATAAAAYSYGPPALQAAAAAATSSGRSRKRPIAAGYADDGTRPAAFVHVPVRVVRGPVAPTPPPSPPPTTADPMDKLRQLVHEAMDEHFANRHQELYGDGFDKHQQQQPQQQQVVYSAKYTNKRQPTVDREKQQRTADAVKSATKPGKDVAQDVDADGSDDRLTLAEISAYMGAKPAETVLSAGGHRYVLSDALQQSYRHQLQLQNQQLQHHQQYNSGGGGGGGGGEDHHPQYLRYVSPFDAIYELPAARWTYK